MQFFASLLPVLYFCVFIAVGQFAARWFFKDVSPLVRVWLGGVISLLLLLWLPALCAFLMRFTLLAQCVALALCIAFGVVCFLRSRKFACERLLFSHIDMALIVLLPLFAIGFILFLTHTIRPFNGSLHVGQSTFGDLALHLGLTTSIAVQGTFPPQYSILPGAPVGYPFLCDSVSSTFYLLGASLRFSMLLPALFAYALVLLGAYLFFVSWFPHKRVSILATLLFFLGGGLGFVYFFDLLKLYPDNLSRIFTAFYQTPTNNVDFGVKWVNAIADMLIPQRATLFGWALLFPCLYMLRLAAFSDETRWFIPLGVIAGCMPLVHTHSFLALGILSAVLLIQTLFAVPSRERLRGWLFYAGIVILLAGPQLALFTFQQSGSFLQPHFNWANNTDQFLWFYIKNLGLLFILLPIAAYRLEKTDRAFCFGALVIWFFAEFIQFQPNPYDNNKLLFVCFAFLCGIIAKFLVECYDALSHFKGRRFLAVLTLAALFLSGLLTLGREYVSDLQLINADEAQGAEYVKTHAEPDALFLTASNHNNAVAALTGRNIVCGTGAYLYYHGLNYEEREQNLRLLFEEPGAYMPALGQEYGIDYIWLGPYERNSYDCDYAYFSNLPVVFANANLTIYRAANS